MALLPSKELLDGTKNPETTTGEFRVALGHMRDYLFDLLGGNSENREEARAALGAVSASDIQRLRHTSAIAEGTADALSASFETPVRQLANATTLTVCAQFRNETQTPSFRADETSALTIVKGTGQPLEIGDIKGAGHWLELRYDENLNKWVLMNPATGIVTNGIACAEAGGSADVITAQFSPPVTELKNGLKVSIRATAANTSTEPLLQIENFEACPIVKNIDQPLRAGDISGKGYWIDCQYDGVNRKWILQNPAKGIVHTGVPVGTVIHFAASMPPKGYLKADGSAVSRETYPDLFAVVGTRFGEGDGTSTFSLPDLINRFAQGSTLPGQKIEAGLPNITGALSNNAIQSQDVSEKSASGAISITRSGNGNRDGSSPSYSLSFDASRSSSVYGSSHTVQPPALTLLPCIKAFDEVPFITEISAFAQKNEVTGDTGRDGIEPFLSKAWVNFDASSGTVVIKNGCNVQDVVRVEKGVYDVIFDHSTDVGTLTVTASSSALLTSVNRESLTGAYYPPAKGRIRIVTGSGFPPQAEDAADINVIILG